MCPWAQGPVFQAEGETPAPSQILAGFAGSCLQRKAVRVEREWGSRGPAGTQSYMLMDFNKHPVTDSPSWWGLDIFFPRVETHSQQPGPRSLPTGDKSSPLAFSPPFQRKVVFPADRSSGPLTQGLKLPTGLCLFLGSQAQSLLPLHEDSQVPWV